MGNSGTKPDPNEPNDWIKTAKSQKADITPLGKLPKIAAFLQKQINVVPNEGFSKLIISNKLTKRLKTEFDRFKAHHKYSAFVINEGELQNAGVNFRKLETCFYPAIPQTVDTSVARISSEEAAGLAMQSTVSKTPASKTPGKTASKAGDILGPPVQMHMNHVTNLLGRPQYIISQTPKESEIKLFFQLIQRENVRIVVSIVSDFDFGQELAYDYFDVQESELNQCAQTYYECIKVIKADFDFDVRDFVIKKKNGQHLHEFVHIHCKTLCQDWGTQKDPPDLLAMVQKAKQVSDRMGINEATNEKDKLLVHCTNGLDKSAAFIASLITLDWITTRGFPINIPSIVEKVLACRACGIQYLRTYALLYCVAFEYTKIFDPKGVKFEKKVSQQIPDAWKDDE